MKKLRAIATVAALLLAGTMAHAQAVPSNVGQSSVGMPAQLVNVGFEPQLNAQMPLDLPFVDENGSAVQLRDYFQQKPVLLAFVYYGCPMLCNQVEQGVVGALKMLSFTPGRDYEVVFVSFDPRESADMAAQKKKTALSHFGRPETAGGWHFLTGTKESHRCRHQSGEFPVQLRYQDQSFCACQRHHAADPGWTNLAIFLWSGISGQRCAAGAGGCFGGENRHAHRSCAAVLLSVRPVSSATYSASILKSFAWAEF